MSSPRTRQARRRQNGRSSFDFTKTTSLIIEKWSEAFAVIARIRRKLADI